MREPRFHAVPCAFATLAQAKAQVHMTRNFDRVCDRCRVRAAQGSPIDLSAPGGADRTALPTSSRAASPGFSSPAVSAATSLTHISTARPRGSGTSGDFLSVGRLGEQFRSVSDTPSLPEPVTRGHCSPPT
jgi:hypothetical protein